MAAPASPADLIFVFPGEVPGRARCAARLFRDGVAPAILFSGGRMAPELEVVGRPLTDAEVNAAIAVSEGVPPAAIEVVSAGTSTWEDAGVLRGRLEARPVKAVLAVTSPMHSRRALTTLRLAAAGTGADVRVTSCEAPYSPTALWWLEERPLIQVMNESAKLVLYALRFFLPAALGAAGPPLPEVRPAAPPSGPPLGAAAADQPS